MYERLSASSDTSLPFKSTQVKSHVHTHNREDASSTVTANTTEGSCRAPRESHRMGEASDTSLPFKSTQVTHPSDPPGVRDLPARLIFALGKSQI